MDCNTESPCVDGEGPAQGNSCAPGRQSQMAEQNRPEALGSFLEEEIRNITEASEYLKKSFR